MTADGRDCHTIARSGLDLESTSASTNDNVEGDVHAIGVISTIISGRPPLKERQVMRG